MTGFTAYARGEFLANVTAEDAWEAFVHAFVDMPVPGKPLWSLPELANFEEGAVFRLGEYQLRVEEWEPPRTYCYSMLKPNGQVMTTFSAVISGRDSPPMFEAAFGVMGLFSRKKAFSEIRSRLGTKGLAATAYWGPWLRLPIARGGVRFRD
jgi:hypothetical protein